MVNSCQQNFKIIIKIYSKYSRRVFFLEKGKNGFSRKSLILLEKGSKLLKKGKISGEN